MILKTDYSNVQSRNRELSPESSLRLWTRIWAKVSYVRSSRQKDCFFPAPKDNINWWVHDDSFIFITLSICMQADSAGLLSSVITVTSSPHISLIWSQMISWPRTVIKCGRSEVCELRSMADTCRRAPTRIERSCEDWNTDTICVMLSSVNEWGRFSSFPEDMGSGVETTSKSFKPVE